MEKKILKICFILGSICLTGCGNRGVSDEKVSETINGMEETEAIDGLEKNYDDELFISFREGDRWGCMTLDGEVAIGPEYEMPLYFSEGLALFCEKGKFGYINKYNQIVVEPQYDDAKEFREGYAGVCIKKKVADQELEKWGFIDKNGELIFETECEEIGEGFSEGLANVCIGGKWGYIDTEGEFVLKPEYDRAAEFQNEAALVTKGNKQRFIRRENFSILMENHDPDIELKSYFEGVAYAECIVERYDDGMSSVTYAHINEDGERIINCDVAEEFSEGLAAVKINGLWGYMNTNGELVIEPQYEKAGSFSEGLAVAAFQDENYLIDMDGTIVFQTKSYDLILGDDGYAFTTNRVGAGAIVAEDLKEGGHYYVLDRNGTVLLDVSDVNGSGVWIGADSLETGERFVYGTKVDENTGDAWAEELACIDRDGNVIWERKD